MNTHPTLLRNLESVLVIVDMQSKLSAVMVEKDGWLWETERGFVVPDDWQQKAELRLQGLQKK